METTRRNMKTNLHEHTVRVGVLLHRMDAHGIVGLSQHSGEPFQSRLRVASAYDGIVAVYSPVPL